MSNLELKVPPVLAFVLACAGLWGLSVQCSPIRLPWLILQYGAWLFGGLGLCVGFYASLSFKGQGTTVNPMRPEQASKLVDSGIFRYSRNPMYLSLTLLLMAFSLWLGCLANLLIVLLFILYITRFQIIPEERTLLARFGRAYADYCVQVRRWL